MLGGRRQRGPERDLVATLLEDAVGREAMKVDVEVAAQAQDYGDNAAQEGRDRDEPALALALRLDRAHFLTDRSRVTAAKVPCALAPQSSIRSASTTRRSTEPYRRPCSELSGPVRTRERAAPSPRTAPRSSRS